MHHSRRQFLKLLGMAVGASLSGCGGGGVPPGGAGPGNPAPLAYEFVPVIRSGQDLPAQARAASNGAPFMGGVVINDRRHVCFHCLDEQEVRGVYRVDVSDQGVMEPVRKVIREGDVLPDGTVVADFSDGELDNLDDYLFMVEDPEGVHSLQYCPGGGEFSPLCKDFQELNAGVKLCGEIYPVEALSDDGRILCVSDYFDEDGEAEGEGLFLMPADQPDQAQLIVAHGQLIPGTTACIKSIGVAELSSGGRYLIQGSASPTLDDGSIDSSGSPMTYVLTGVVGESPQVLALDPQLGGDDQGYIRASAVMCPRLKGNSVGAVLQIDENVTELWIDQKRLLQGNLEGGGSLSPRGSQILSFLPPVFGPDGLVYFEVFTADGMELVLFDGSGFHTVLAKGDTLEGQVVETIIFGALPECVNNNGELVFMAEFANGESVILLGLPV